jgi:spermidine synthase
LISGFTGLAYEVIWTRLLVRSLGATSLAVTTVLASYMAGLALGSILFGRLIDRKGNPLRVYGLLQLGIAVFAVAFPLILRMLNPLYAQIYPSLQDRFYLLSFARFVLCFLVLLIPTCLMGGTLPVLSRFVTTGMSTLTERVGRLYALNTLGAVGGVVGTGFLLLPQLGIRNATWLCAALNVGIMIVAFGISRGGRPGGVPDRADTEVVGDGSAPSRRRMILVVFAATGFCALAVEVIWTRILALIIGTTVYAFATMLATFLLGLAVGSAVFAGFAQRTKSPGRSLGLLVAAVGITTFLSTHAFGKLPVLYMIFYEKTGGSGGGLPWFQFAVCSIVMFLPAFLMGGVFPLVARLYARGLPRVGSEIGVIYAFNTAGAILGSVAGSFLFLRLWGGITSLILISMIYVAIGLVVLIGIPRFRPSGARFAMAGGVAVIAAILILNAPAVDRKMMTSGVYRYAPIFKNREGLKRSLRQSKTLYFDEGLDATVAVERFHDEITLAIDGKVDASTGTGDMTTQVLLAQLPLHFHPKPETLLVIGLGSGVTLGSAQQHEIASIDCVELLENVVEASDHFRQFNYDCLAHPGTNLIVGDARNHLLLTPKLYDVIISEPTNPWISGVNDLFTLEFFRLAKARLAADGIMCAWFHTYHMGDDDVRIMLNTFTAVFPEAVLWMSGGQDLILLGSTRPLKFDSRLMGIMRKPSVAGDLARIWIHAPEDLLSSYVAGPVGLRSFAESATQLNTDDNMLLEFSAGAKVLEETQETHLANFLGITEVPPLGGFPDSVGARIRTAAEARRKAIGGTLALVAGQTDRAMVLYEQAYQLAPSDPYVLERYTEINLTVGNSLYSEGRYDEAIRSYEKALVEPDYRRSWLAYIGLGACYIAEGDYRSAEQNIGASIDKNPHNAEAWYNMGKIQYALRKPDEAVAGFRRALEILPHAGAANDLARIYLQVIKDPSEAVELAEFAVSLETKASYLNTLGWAYHSRGDFGQAGRVLRRALELEPESSEALYRLGVLEVSIGRLDGARDYLREARRIGGSDVYGRMAEQELKRLRDQNR